MDKDHKSFLFNFIAGSIFGAALVVLPLRISDMINDKEEDRIKDVARNHSKMVITEGLNEDGEMQQDTIYMVPKHAYDALTND